MAIKDGYQLIRSRRKTLTIRVTQEGKVEAHAPMRMPVREIEAFLARKAEWVAHCQAEAIRRIELRTAYEPDALPLLGREYPLRRGGVEQAAFDGTAFHAPAGSFETAKPPLELLYRKLAAQDLRERVRVWSERMGVQATGVRINGAKGRWGSCSGKNGLNFSWRLILAPTEIVDYVVVHELAHIRQHNHSPAFWAEVAGWMPDYVARRTELRAFGRRMLEQGW